MENQIEKEEKAKKLLWIPIVLLILLVGLLTFIISMRLFTPEDTWICSNGEWVEHGKPSSPKPTLECEKTNTSSEGNTEGSNNSMTVPSVNPLDTTHNAINSIPNENPVGPLQLNGFFGFMSPVFDIMADFGTKVCQWGRPKDQANTCPSIKVGFQEFFAR